MALDDMVFNESEREAESAGRPTGIPAPVPMLHYELELEHVGGSKRVVQILGVEGAHKLLFRWGSSPGLWALDTALNCIVRAPDWSATNIRAAKKILGALKAERGLRRAS